MYCSTLVSVSDLKTFQNLREFQLHSFLAILKVIFSCVFVTFLFCTVSLATGKQGIPASHPLMLQTYNCNFYTLPKRHFEYLELAYFSMVPNRNNFLDQNNPENGKELPCSLKGCSLFLKETLYQRE